MEIARKIEGSGAPAEHTHTNWGLRINPPIEHNNMLMVRVINAIAPWHFRKYGGIRKELGKVIGDVTHACISHWRHGRRIPEPATLRKLIGYLAVREAEARELRLGLETLLRRPRKMPFGHPGNRPTEEP
jgi:hypothetical protein